MPVYSPAVWVMHDGRDDVAADIFSAGYIAIGWDDLGDLGDLGTVARIRARLAAIYDSTDNGVITKWSNQLFSFFNEMRVGDIIAYPRTQDDQIWLGEVVGAYRYATNRQRFRSERKVVWKIFPRQGFSQEARLELGHRPSIFRVSRVAAEVLAKFGYQDNVPEAQEIRDFISAQQGRKSAGQGFGLDVAERRAIEDYAMDKAKEHYIAQGWQVNPDGYEDVHKRCPYDLHCIRSGGEELRVEVKGTKSAGMQILLTEGEVEHARAHANVALFIVANIVSAPTSGKPNVSGGTVIVRQPWRVGDGALKPIAYTYAIPEEEHE